MAATQGNFATLSSSFPSLSAANLLIVTGTFVMAIGFVGCIGALKENKCLLLTVSLLGPSLWLSVHQLHLGGLSRTRALCGWRGCWVWGTEKDPISK